jgi:hypothetical protein
MKSKYTLQIPPKCECFHHSYNMHRHGSEAGLSWHFAAAVPTAKFIKYVFSVYILCDVTTNAFLSHSFPADTSLPEERHVCY